MENYLKIGISLLAGIGCYLLFGSIDKDEQKSNNVKENSEENSSDKVVNNSEIGDDSPTEEEDVNPGVIVTLNKIHKFFNDFIAVLRNLISAFENGNKLLVAGRSQMNDYS